MREDGKGMVVDYVKYNDTPVTFTHKNDVLLITVKEINNKIVFIRTLKKGGSEHSFGINVAEMAGMPKEIIRKSKERLKQLEKTRGKSNSSTNERTQLSFFQLDDPTLIEIRDEIDNIVIDDLTPVEALIKLNEIKKLIGK